MAARPLYRTVCKRFTETIKSLTFSGKMNSHGWLHSTALTEDGWMFSVYADNIYCTSPGEDKAERLWISRKKVEDGYFELDEWSKVYKFFEQKIILEREQDELRRACRRLPKSAAKTTRRL